MDAIRSRNVPFLTTAFDAAKPAFPVMLDTDGQRPNEIAPLAPYLALAQVTIEFVGPDATVTRAMEALQTAARAKCAHGLVLCPRDDTSDQRILRAIEDAHAVSAETQIVVHPPMSANESMLDRRWTSLLDQAMATHADTRVALRIPPPAGLR